MMARDFGQIMCPISTRILKVKTKKSPSINRT